MHATWRALCARVLGVLLGAAALAIPASPAAQAQIRIDARAEIAQVLFAASATQAAMEKAADERFNQQRTEIERLRSQGERARAQLVQAQERLVGEIAARDRAFAQEIAVLRRAAEDIAATPEGARALARFNAGDEAGALAVLDQLIDARERARLARANVETAAERRRVARLAYNVRHRVGAASVIARFEEVVRLDPGVHSDWIALRDLYQSGERPADAIRAGERAIASAATDDERAEALCTLASLFEREKNFPSARSQYEACVTVRTRLLAADPSSSTSWYDLGKALNDSGNVLAKLQDVHGARNRFEEALNLSRRYPRSFEYRESFGLSAIGNLMLLALERRDLALAQRTVSAMRERAEIYPSELSSLALYLRFQAELLSRRRDAEGARAAEDEGLAIARRRAAQDPDQNDAFGRMLESVIETRLSRSDFAGARQVADESLELARRKAAAEPADAFAQLRLTRILRDYRAVALIGQNELAPARAACEEAVQISRRIALANPGSDRFAGDYAEGLTCEGDVLRVQGDLTGARARYEQAREIWRPLFEKVRANRPTMPFVPWLLAQLKLRIGEVHLAEGRRQDAIHELDRLPAVFRDYADRFSDGNDATRLLYGDGAKFRWWQVGAEFRFAQASAAAAGIQRAVERFRELDAAGWQHVHAPWVDELRALTRAQRGRRPS